MTVTTPEPRPIPRHRDPAIPPPDHPRVWAVRSVVSAAAVPAAQEAEASSAEASLAQAHTELLAHPAIRGWAGGEEDCAAPAADDGVGAADGGAGESTGAEARAEFVARLRVVLGLHVASVRQRQTLAQEKAQLEQQLEAARREAEEARTVCEANRQILDSLLHDQEPREATAAGRGQGGRRTLRQGFMARMRSLTASSGSRSGSMDAGGGGE